MHAIVVSKKRAHTESAVNLLHYLFPLLIHTLEKETTRIGDKNLIQKWSVGVSALNLTASFQLIQKLCVKSGLSSL